MTEFILEGFPQDNTHIIHRPKQIGRQVIFLTMKLKLPKSSDMSVPSFGWNKKTQKGSESASASAPQIADEADIIEDIRDDIDRPKEIDEEEATDAITAVSKADDTSRQEGDVDPRDDPKEDLPSKDIEDFITAEDAPIETTAGPEFESIGSEPKAPPTFFGRMKAAGAARARALPAATAKAKASFGERIKKLKKGKPSSNSPPVENDIAVEKASETNAVEKALEINDSVQQEHSIERRDILETKDSVQQESVADIRDETPLESATLPAKEEVQAVAEEPSAPEDSLEKKEDIVKDNQDVAVTEASEEAPAKELEAPAVLEANESRDDQPSIEAVQMDGVVALGFFQSKGSIMKEADDLLAQVSSLPPML